MDTQTPRARTDDEIAVRQLSEAELPAADRILRDAFNTFTGAPDLFGDKDYAWTRWRADPAAALAAEVDGDLVGSNFVTNWGSVAFFGPLSVRPDHWDHGVAKALVEVTLDLFAAWSVELAGLFTFPQSPKHIGLYQRFGFWPRFLTPIMSKLVETGDARGWLSYSAATVEERTSYLTGCAELTDAIYDGLDVRREILAAQGQNLGDTLLLADGSRIEAVALCHAGPGTEAGGGSAYVKFAAVRPGPMAADVFGRLLDACESWAAKAGASRLEVGVNVGRHEAYRTLLARGFRTDLEGIAMHRSNDTGYSRGGLYVLDDWR
jgi:GNAT superfamily N-acetyltransferase